MLERDLHGDPNVFRRACNRAFQLEERFLEEEVGRIAAAGTSPFSLHNT